MANYTLPSTTRISRVNRTLNSSTFLQASPFSGGVQSQDWGGSWWEYDLDFDVTQDAEGKALSAFLTRLRGPANTFTFRDPSINNKFQPGTILVKGAGQTGNTLVTDGWAPVEGNLLPSALDFTVGWSSGDFTIVPSNALGGSVSGQKLTNGGSNSSRAIIQPVTTVRPTDVKYFRVICEDGGEATATDKITVGIRNNTKSSWAALYEYTFSTNTIAPLVINASGAFNASGSFLVDGRGPSNGGTRAVDLRVSVESADIADQFIAFIYPTGLTQNTDSVHLYFTSYTEGEGFGGSSPIVHTLLEAGDFISIGSGADARLHQVAQNATMITSDRSCNLVLEPALRSSPANNAVVEVVDPIVALRPLQAIPNSISTPINYRFTMQAREDI